MGAIQRPALPVRRRAAQPGSPATIYIARLPPPERPVSSKRGLGVSLCAWKYGVAQISPVRIIERVKLNRIGALFLGHRVQPGATGLHIGSVKDPLPSTVEGEYGRKNGQGVFLPHGNKPVLKSLKKVGSLGVREHT